MKVRGERSILRDLGSIGLPERGRTRRVESAYSLNLRIVWRDRDWSAANPSGFSKIRVAMTNLTLLVRPFSLK